jgi:hypothetical protein
MAKISQKPGREPQAQISFPMPCELIEQVKARARQEDRSFAGTMRFLVREGLEKIGEAAAS